MKNSVFLAVVIAARLVAGEIEVTSKQFYADENAGKSIFTGNVVATRGADILKGDKMIVLFTSDREITRFEATGNAKFSVKPDENASYVGEADELIYLPSDGVYTLKGHAWVEDLTNKRKVIGEHIIFNEKTRVAKVSGEDAKPVKLIFTVKDRNESAKD